MQPQAEPEQPFEEPWHAQLFAITHALAQAGVFAWPDWSAWFSDALARADAAGSPKDSSAYYDIWLTAFESFLADRNLADGNSLTTLKAAWSEAYLSTPHGAPVELPRP